MALAPIVPRLHSLCLPIATAGITVGRVSYVTVEGVSRVAGVGLALVRCQAVAATVHCCDTPDDKDDGKKTEDQDIEHGPLDHGRPEMSCPHCFAAAPPALRPGAGGRGSCHPSGTLELRFHGVPVGGDRVRVRAAVGAAALAIGVPDRTAWLTTPPIRPI